MDTKDFYNEVPLTKMGERTPRVQVYKSESHKLCQAFNVVEGKTIVKSMPVQLNENGSIEPYDGEDGSVYLGIAITDSINPAYREQRNFPIEVTVMVEGYALCNYTPKAELTKCGYVKPTTDEPVGGRFVQVEESDSKTKFINLHPAEVGEVVTVLVR